VAPHCGLVAQHNWSTSTICSVRCGPFLGQCKCQDVFNVFSDFGKLLYEFYVFTEDSKILSVGDVPCRVYLWF